MPRPRPAPHITRDDPFLQDLAVWGPDLLERLTARHGEAALRERLEAGLITTRATPLGDGAILTYKGRLRAGFTSRYAPSAGAILDRLALRCAVEALEREGYRAARPATRAAARLVAPDGKPAWVFGTFEGSVAQVIATALRNVWDEVVAEDARVIVFHPHPKRLAHVRRSFGERVSVREPVWPKLPWA